MTSDQFPAAAGARDIAVVGMAVRLPEADDTRQFLANLRDGRDSVRELSAGRRGRTSMPLDEDFQLNGYIEDIDSFDHAFFGISHGEAQVMAPEHRLLLQTAYQAVEDAAQRPAALNGRRVSVYVGDTRIAYHQLVRTIEAPMVMGVHVAATAGRIARFFGLSGPAAMVDSSCSSGLLAVHHAVNDLVLGDAEMALVGGVNLNLFGDPVQDDAGLDLGIRSADGKTRAFSAEADGTGSGEAVVAVLLKPLDDALRDGDPVHAVIKGIAANNVADRSSSLTAPDSAAQAEVITRAWRKAGVDPATVSYVEAHGTATRLGDPIEIEALDLAFGPTAAAKHSVALSSVKSNIGHTWSVSGLVGLVKAVLALRYRQLFPSLHTEALSPLIDFSESAVSVTRQLTPWEPAAGIRRAGVSSFGVMGTNVHAVLEEAPAPTTDESSAATAPDGYWIPLSAKSPTALSANIAALRARVESDPRLRIADVQRTLAEGRDHHPYRYAVTADDLDGLSRALAEPPTGPSAVGPMTVLLVSGRCPADPGQVSAFRGAHPRFDELYAQCERAAEADGTEADGQFAFQYALHGLLREIGFDFRHVVGEGAGKHVIDAAAGRVPLAEAQRLAHAERAAQPAEPADLDARVDRLLGKLVGARPVLFVEAGPLSTVSGALVARGGAGYRVVSVTEGPAALLRDLYTGGADWNWASTAGGGRRIELPAYQFDKVRCWIDDADLAPARGAAAAPAEESGAAGAAGQRSGPPPVDVLETVTGVWRDVLGTEAVSPSDSFFDLGGDSISGLQVVNRVQKLFGVELDVLTLFDYDTPEDLTGYLGTLLAPEPDAVPDTAEDDADDAAEEAASPAAPGFFPASAAQLNVWLASQFEGGSVAFNLTRSFELTGPVDTTALQKAVDGLTARHDGLRAAFRLEGEQLVQQVAPAGPGTVAVEVRTESAAFPAGSAAVALVREFAARPFDLENGPLLRVQLACFRDERHLLSLSTHHLVADGWSLGLLVRDLSELYAAAVAGTEAALPPVGADYREHHVREARRAQDRREQAAAYWLDTFASVPPALSLPTRAGSAEGRAYTGAYRDYALPAALWQRLKSFARSRGGTPFTSVVSAFAAVLARYSEHGDLVLGTSVADRGEESLEQLVGMLVRTLPLRLSVDAEAGFDALYRQVRGTFTDGLRHLSHPYEELVRDLQERGRTHTPDLFDVLIEFEQFAGAGAGPLEAMAATGLGVEQVDVTLETSVFPLNIMLAEQQGTLGAAVRFDTRLFDPATVDGLWEAFEALLDTALADPDTPLGRLPLLTAREERRVRTLGHRELEFDCGFQIHRAIEHFARTTPGRLALSSATDPAGRRTFAELNTRANRLARYFADELDVTSGEVVALVMDRSVLMVESILALWKCGAAYLPVDPGYPAAFVRGMLESSDVRVVALDPRQAPEGLAAHIPEGCRQVELTEETGQHGDGSDPGLDIEESGLAYVIYTSGSTGKPKGVMVEHLGMLNHLHAKIADLGITEDSVVVQNASNSFDISLWQMFAAPFTGGRTVVASEALQLDPVRFAERVEAEEVTVLEVVPSYLEAMLDAWDRADRPVTLEHLRYLMVTGEACLPRQVNRWLRAYPRIPVVNAYGPTEASDDITHHVMDRPVTSETVPLGRPVPNTLIYVLDEHLRVVPQGARGEIYVSGICVSRGYLNAPEQTARAFLTDPFEPGRRMYRTGDNGRWTEEGNLEYFGRTDSQVKVRGFRVDLGEIERRVDGAPGVKQAAVVVKKLAGAGQDKQLHAYLVLEDDGTVDGCRDHVRRELPHHMVPSEFIVLDRLPLTSNGKVDRPTLAGLRAERSTAVAVAPRTDAERVLAEIWAEVLGLDSVGVTDRFFDIGGNSLRAIQVLARVRGRLGADPGLERFFSHPTVAGLAALLDGTTGTGDQGTIRSLGGPGTYASAPTQGLLLAVEERYTHAQRAAFNRNDLIELHGPVDETLLERSFAALADRHESLRTTFGTSVQPPVQIVHATGALAPAFRVHDLTGRPDPDGAVREFVAARVHVPFDITAEPLVRADLLHTGEDRYVLLTSVHQLVSDGISAAVLHQEWQELYDALVTGRPAALPELPVQYKDISAWRDERLTAQARREHLEYWKRELDGASPEVPLVTDFPRPPVSALSGVRLRRPLDAGLAERFASLASRQDVTEFVVARAAVGLLLLGETGQSDITMGTYTSGRDRLDLEGQIGFHVNTVPLRFRLLPGDDTGSVLSRTQQDMLRAFEHQEYPYGWIMRDLGWERGRDRSPLFDVMVAMDQLDGEEEPRHKGGVLFRARDLPRRSKEADLQFVFIRSARGLELALTYNSELFTEERAQGLLDRLCSILDSMIDERPIAGMVTCEGNATA
ncbi:amino acid adenylation domain-containing protein [Streptomyces chrestomyceticus]|uniref:amino acid adenylation domain-containing protein n=1 Tax=Streptomyces chrestomyceticus TaxID=68185 RepID=UPI0033E12F19